MMLPFILRPILDNCSQLHEEGARAVVVPSLRHELIDSVGVGSVALVGDLFYCKVGDGMWRPLFSTQAERQCAYGNDVCYIGHAVPPSRYRGLVEAGKFYIVRVGYAGNFMEWADAQASPNPEPWDLRESVEYRSIWKCV